MAKRKRDIRNKTINKVVCNQLKSAALHYEHIICLLSRCGSSVGNLGHRRNQVDTMSKAFQAYLHKKATKIMTTPLPSTDLQPQFCSASEESTPLMVSNHAIMVLIMINGEKQLFL